MGKKGFKNKISLTTCKYRKFNLELVKIKRGFDELNQIFSCKKNKCQK